MGPTGRGGIETTVPRQGICHQDNPLFNTVLFRSQCLLLISQFGWDEITIDRTLNPIVRVVEKGRGAVQSSILSFADWVQPNKQAKSQRVRKAVRALIAETEWKNRRQHEQQ